MPQNIQLVYGHVLRWVGGASPNFVGQPREQQHNHPKWDEFRHVCLQLLLFYFIFSFYSNSLPPTTTPTHPLSLSFLLFFVCFSHFSRATSPFNGQPEGNRKKCALKYFYCVHSSSKHEQNSRILGLKCVAAKIENRH